MPSFILIHPTVWPQYTNVADETSRQERQTHRQTRSDSIGRTVLQTVAQKTARFKTGCEDDNGYISQLNQQKSTRRPASAERTARRQFQATAQPVSRTQASDAMTSRLPRYEAKCVQRRCFQCGSVLCVQISREQSYPCQNIDTVRKAIDCATTLPLRVFI